MIRFDEVGIGRRFDSNGHECIKVPQYSKNGLDVNCYKTSNGDMHYLKDDEMVELVDSCKNCKYYSNGRCEGVGPVVSYDMASAWLEEDPETFKCSEWEDKQ